MNPLVEDIGVILTIAGVSGSVVAYFLNKEIERLKSENKILKERNRDIEEVIDKKIDDIHNVAELVMLTFKPLNHEFFSDIMYCLANESWRLGLASGSDEENVYKDKAKRCIIDNMLRIKLFVWYCGYRELFTNNNEINCELIHSTIQNIVNIYKAKWIEEVKIPVYICNKFNRKHDSRAFYIVEKMEELFREGGDEIGNIDYTKKKFLDYSHVLLRDTIRDVFHIMKDIELKEQDKNYEIVYQNPVRDKTKEEICSLCSKEYSMKKNKST
jgi:hypothetical protein